MTDMYSLDTSLDTSYYAVMTLCDSTLHVVCNQAAPMSMVMYMWLSTLSLSLEMAQGHVLQYCILT